MHKHVVQIYNTKCKNVDMYTLKMEAASVVVQCGLVVPLVVDSSPDSKSSYSVGVNGFTGSGSFAFAVRSWWL